MHILPRELLEDEGTAESNKRKEMAIGNGISSTNISIGPYTTNHRTEWNQRLADTFGFKMAQTTG